MSDRRLERALARLGGVRAPVEVKGRVTALTGLVLRARLPGVHAGELVRIRMAGREADRTRGADGGELEAEVVGFSGDEVILMPLGDPSGVGPDSLVEAAGLAELGVGEALLGRVLDGLGRPLDGESPAGQLTPWPLARSAPDPLSRPRITRPLQLGVRALDGLLTVGEGQRVGLFAGSGVGKSTLLGQIARQTNADICVVCLVGERGREVREFIEESLGEEGLSRSVVVCATSDVPPLVRLKSAQVATAIAEYFRACGSRVLLLMDSVTRYARALREVGLAAGEPPARRGYPPSVFAALPKLLERTGTSPEGSITAIYTVLVEGGDMEEPIADEVRGILDGHVVLTRDLAQRNHWPAIDILQSLSRVMSQITDSTHQKAAAELRQLLAAYERRRDLIALGAYERGSEPQTDRAIDLMPRLEAYLCQHPNEENTLEQSVEALQALFD
ncbi:MAG: flagellum-specific ATP synthase FliI [Proteobacteria bacterium]|nr:MAG: flagellum-specific ATP synthase FliI [Pseudomonadota bacterium]